LPQIEGELQQLLSQKKYNPFNLIATDSHTSIKFSWDGHALVQQVIADQEAYMISSSSVDSINVLTKRAAWFSQFKNRVKNKDCPSQYILNEFHLQQQENDSSSSILMTRNETHTKSISQLIINNDLLEYSYIDETQLKYYLKQPLEGKCHFKRLKLHC
jgi:hypothetical protein